LQAENQAFDIVILELKKKCDKLNQILIFLTNNGWESEISEIRFFHHEIFIRKSYLKK
jgi:hypothetical protein